MTQRILTQLRGSEVMDLVKELHGWSVDAVEETVGELLDNRVPEPKLRLRYKVALAIAANLRDAPFAIEDVRQILVWGEEGGYRGQVRSEFRFFRPVSVQGFEVWSRGLGLGALEEEPV